MLTLEELKDNKKKCRPVFIANYFKTDINWQNILDFVWEQTTIGNDDLKKNKTDKDSNVDVFGNILTQHPFWIAPQTGLIWKHFSEIKQLLIQLNEQCGYEIDFENCDYYKHWDIRRCSCTSLWHSEGLKVSLGEKFINEHSDPWDACYFQIMGESYWEIKSLDGTFNEIYHLKNGDLLFFPKETTHSVWAKGPRAGILINTDTNKDW